MEKYLASARMARLEKTNGGALTLLPDAALKAATLVALIFLWRAALAQGAEAGMTLPQLLAYTYVSALLSDLMVVKTRATGWLSEGVMLRLYGRPASAVGQLVAETAGGWLPMLALFSLPMAALAPLLGVSLAPASAWFFPSLSLCVSLGFAVDLLFACLTIRLRSMTWLIDRIRLAVTSLLSGAVIPLRLLPPGIAELMRYQPLACLGGSPLSLFVGAAGAREVLLPQLFWNAVLWPVALLILMKSRERMVGYGG